MIKLVLLRHGQSLWNLENRFTGWTDVGLSAQGIEEAKAAGRLLKEKGYVFDEAYSSILKRATETLGLVLSEMGESGIPKRFSWRLNERHYGALQGLNKCDSARKWGAEQIHVWRRSADVPPPPLSKEDPRYPGNQQIYRDLIRKGLMEEKDLPLSECLLDTAKRVKLYFMKEIAPSIREGRRALVVAHGNSLRALVMELENLSPEAIASVEIPTGKPLVYELNEENLSVIGKYYL
ncbi:MAG: 2,3-diphosphoglycerate-dependent phosphoglycerate mutase [Bacilli bacterium]|jgi:2,3-bisphosphoglycerate-dependent phosphoglycerate mutase|nr:2,3-diphosphoglycerate-dependent phosphoglycerate mutase [Bacilli bacterium]